MYLTTVEPGETLKVGCVSVEFIRASEGMIYLGIRDGGLTVEVEPAPDQVEGDDADADVIAFPGPHVVDDEIDTKLLPLVRVH